LHLPDPTVINCKESPQVWGESFSLVERYGKTRRDGYKGNRNNSKCVSASAESDRAAHQR